MVFETMQADELNSSEYDAWIEVFGFIPVESNHNTNCLKCGESITNFELDINNGVCPCCGSVIVESDIPI
jgi:hypothetical protein